MIIISIAGRKSYYVSKFSIENVFLPYEVFTIIKKKCTLLKSFSFFHYLNIFIFMETNGIWNTFESIKSALFRDSKEVDIYVVEPQHILYENIWKYVKMGKGLKSMYKTGAIGFGFLRIFIKQFFFPAEFEASA